MPSNPEPTLVFYKSMSCHHCDKLSKIWETPPKPGEDSVVSALKKVYPNLRFATVTAKDNTGKFDENLAPKDLIRYGRWFPSILLVPGRLWDAAMAKLGPKNDVKLIDGVQVMNGYIDATGELKNQNKYDVRIPSRFGDWLAEALKNEDFKKVQNGTGPISDQQVQVPLLNTPAQPIPPMLSGIVRPLNTMTNYAAGGNLGNPGNGGSNETPENVCSMRIIPRHK